MTDYQQQQDDVIDPNCVCPLDCDCPRGRRIAKLKQIVNDNPLSKASLPSIIFQSWLTPIVDLGSEHYLCDDDIPEMAPEHRTSAMLKDFYEQWSIRRDRYKEQLMYRENENIKEENDSFDYVPSGSSNLNTSTDASARSTTEILKEKEIAPPSLLTSLVMANYSYLLISGVVELFYYAINFSQPYTIKALTGFFQDYANGLNPPLWHGLLYSLLLGGLAWLGAFIIIGKFYCATITAAHGRATIMAAIFEKALKVAPASLGDMTSGMVMNLMSNDAQRTHEAAMFANIAWSSPTMIIICLILMYQELGSSAFATIALMLVLFPYQLFMARVLRANRMMTIKLTDTRVKLINEMLQGVRVIKLYAWEDAVRKALATVRAKELHYVRKGIILKSINQTIIFLWPTIVTFLTLCLYAVLEDGDLDESKVFMVLSFLNVIRFPINLLPQCLQALVEMFVASKRVSTYLNKEELSTRTPLPAAHNRGKQFVSDFQYYTSTVPADVSTSLDQTVLTRQSSNVEVIVRSDIPVCSRGLAIAVNKCSFYWSRDALPILSNITLNVPQGCLLGVVGSVGVGKSSLLSGILGEMHVGYHGQHGHQRDMVKHTTADCDVGEYSFTDIAPIIPLDAVCIRGRVGYFTQDPWLINATLAENITLGLPFDQAKFDAVVHASALGPDLAILNEGAQTMIGESGINLSGGQKSRIACARVLYRADMLDVVLFDDPFAAVDLGVGKQMFHNGILDYLSGKTVILALNSHLHFLQECDRIIVLESAEVGSDASSLPSRFTSASSDAAEEQSTRMPTVIAHDGTYEELVAKGINLAQYETTEDELEEETANVADSLPVSTLQYTTSSSVALNLNQHGFIPLVPSTKAGSATPDTDTLDSIDLIPTVGSVTHFELEPTTEHSSRLVLAEGNVEESNNAFEEEVEHMRERTGIMDVNYERRHSNSQRRESVGDEVHMNISFNGAHDGDGSDDEVMINIGHRPTTNKTTVVNNLSGSNLNYTDVIEPAAPPAVTRTTNSEENMNNAKYSFQNTQSVDPESKYTYSIKNDEDEEVDTTTIPSSNEGEVTATATAIPTTVTTTTVTTLTTAPVTTVATTSTPAPLGPTSSRSPPKEKVETGHIGLSTYLSYIQGSGGKTGMVFRIVLLLIMTIAAQLLRMLVDYWMLEWANDSPYGPDSEHTQQWWMASSALILAASAIMLIVRMLTFLVVNMDSSQYLHDTTFAKVLNAPMVWFDTTPLGQVMNRFGKDMDVLDTSLPDLINNVSQQFFVLIGILVLACATSFLFVVPIAFILFAIYKFQKIFRKSATQLKRVETTTFAPMYASFSAATKGASSIRAFGLQDQFIKRHFSLIDNNIKVVVVYNLLQRWLAFRLDCLACIYIICVGCFAVLLRDYISAPIAGLAVTYSMQLLGLLQFSVRMYIMLEGAMTSVERLHQYSSLAQEPAYRTDEKLLAKLKHRGAVEYGYIPRASTAARQEVAPAVVFASQSAFQYREGKQYLPSIDEEDVELGTASSIVERSTLAAPYNPAADRVFGWPWVGTVSFKNVSMAYRPELPLVLHNLSLEIPAGKKVGVVGRTGSGKSSLLLALFRMVELCRGSIEIDGVDISKLGVGDLRSRMSIIPQQPVMFSGTVRYNLDPFGQHTDTELRTALERVNMLATINNLPKGLDATVEEFGGNFSQGERQLLCIGRALLRNNPIIVLDEATAAVDPSTDQAIQNTIRTCFGHCTIITIAHRLETIVDYDYVLVLGPIDSEHIMLSSEYISGQPCPIIEDDETMQSMREFDHPYKLLSSPHSALHKMAMEGGEAVLNSLLAKSSAAYDGTI